jgi:DMSO/TMAO reductase YedYZ molybdopterin-dependent catalytic subunit
MYVRCHFAVPRVTVKDWKIKVGGHVRTEHAVSYADLRAMKSVSTVATLECAGNRRSEFGAPPGGEVVWGPGAVGTVRWSGVPLRDILQRAGVLEGATEVLAEGLDTGKVTPTKKPTRYIRALPIKKATAEDTLIALEMNGKRLAPEHGFPARLVVPGWYGMASVKWLSSIRVLSGPPYRGYFNGTKYVYYYEEDGKVSAEPVAEVRVNSNIVSPVGGARLVLGVPTTIEGRAWSGAGKITSVDVDFGEGWTKAELAAGRGAFAWVKWGLRWVPRTKGTVNIKARATDERGNAQGDSPVENRLQYGYNAVSKALVTVVGRETPRGPNP